MWGSNCRPIPSTPFVAISTPLACCGQLTSLTNAQVWIFDECRGIPIKALQTLFAISSSRIVSTIITQSSTAPCFYGNLGVKMTAGSSSITLALCKTQKEEYQSSNNYSFCRVLQWSVHYLHRQLPWHCLEVSNVWLGPFAGSHGRSLNRGWHRSQLSPSVLPPHLHLEFTCTHNTRRVYRGKGTG